MGEILSQPGQEETFLQGTVVRLQLCCFLYEKVIHPDSLSRSLVFFSRTHHSGWYSWMCSLIQVLLEQMVSITHIFPHLQSGQYISSDSRSRSLDGAKHTADFCWEILLWSHLWLRWNNSIGYVWTCICYFGRLYRVSFCLQTTGCWWLWLCVLRGVAQHTC
jgi:hypothetical protein